MKRFLIYCLRWQLSTPILALSTWYFACLGWLWSAVISNLIGAVLIYKIDQKIFSNKISNKKIDNYDL